ncbi:MAG: hypothetical protein O3A53_16105 [Acidobacteria bacterium]|nr:hypothetical protein [Acidobacteriota bacterium]MDA1236307.1 hypothetical protein [Acidobacteriota bacterium]
MLARSADEVIVERDPLEPDGRAQAAPVLSGTANQIEWAERIRRRVNDEFDRVAATFCAVAAKQDAEAQADTQAIIEILEEKRTEVMRRDQAGYFIHDWQEITDQVRQMIFHDVRFAPIRERQSARRLKQPTAGK